MKYSKLFSKTLRQAPKDADTINHKLLTQAGFIDQLMAGVYSYLPLGLRVLNKISQIVREEMDNVGGQEVLMPILHPSAIWKTTGGWEKVDVLFKIVSRTEKEYALAQSAEEVVTPLVLSRVKSYSDLPLAVYQIQWKYRDELRAKSGILRGREFLMKDMYSFHETEEDFLKFYEEAKKAYLKVFKRFGLIAKVTEASGGSFSDKISYEFEVLTDAGEDTIIYCPACDFAINSEIARDIKIGDKCHRCGEAEFLEGKSAEVGNIFDLGQKYSKDFSLSINSKGGSKVFPFMGCYGIGITRVMAVIVEKFHDDKGIIWPDSVSPFKVHLIGLDLEDKEIRRKAEEVYNLIQNDEVLISTEGRNQACLFDDRVDVRAGEKFADADLIGIPYRVVISKKTQGKLEVKKRDSKQTEFLSFKELLKKIKG